MAWEAWVTLAVLAAVLLGLVRNWAGPDVLLLGAMTLLMSLSLFSDRMPQPAEIVAGFGNPGAVTVGVLFVVAAGLTQTGAMQTLMQPILGRPGSLGWAQSRLMLPVAAGSAFLNNTPIVAMLLPVVSDWAKKIGVSPSRLLIPLSYAAIAGGMCTLIGTSTNLLVYGLLIGDGLELGLFTIGLVGLPVAVVVLLYCLTAGRWLLPERKAAIQLDDDPRSYTVEMIVQPGSGLVGKSIEAAGLRSLPGLYLSEIDRDGQVMPAVGPETKLHSEDRLIFVGVLESVIDLRKIRGLAVATDQVFKLDAPQGHRRLIEAVVSRSCPLIGQTIRSGRFRSQYGAVVIAVARDGERLTGKIGDIQLHSGDVLLLEGDASFLQRQRNSRDFYLVSGVDAASPPRHDKLWIALGILSLFVVGMATGWVSPLNGALLAAAGMGLTGCITATAARQSIDWSVLLVIAAALGIGMAVHASGLAHGIAVVVLNMVGENPWLALVAIYLLTNLFTEAITNNAAAVLIYPIAKALAVDLDVDFLPFAIVIMIAASASFATPIGYQTNLMVYGPGGYRFTDYLRIGLPLNLLVLIVAIALTPLFFPF